MAQGNYLGMIWKEVLLRRTYASRIPFNSEITIGDKLPRVHNTILECCFRPNEHLLYDSYRDNLVKRVVSQDNPTDVPKWSFGT